MMNGFLHYIQDVFIIKTSRPGRREVFFIWLNFRSKRRVFSTRMFRLIILRQYEEFVPGFPAFFRKSENLSLP